MQIYDFRYVAIGCAKHPEESLAGRFDEWADLKAAYESEVWLRTLEKMGPPKANWVSVGDRANDIYDFLNNANRLRWKYVVRARHDRKVEIDGKQTCLFSWIRQQTAKCTSKLYLKAKGEEFSGEVTLEITWTKAKLFPPGNEGIAAEEVTYIRVWCPERPRLEWILITNLPVNNEKDALKKSQKEKKDKESQ